jgi:hypothetical protein
MVKLIPKPKFNFLFVTLGCLVTAVLFVTTSKPRFNLHEIGNEKNFIDGSAVVTLELRSLMARYIFCFINCVL